MGHKGQAMQLIGIGACLMLALFMSTPTQAQGAVKVSPVRSELKVSPGRSATATLQVNNPTAENIKLNIELDDFTASEDGDWPAVLMDDKSGVFGRSLKRFLSAPSEVDVPPAGQSKIEVQIKVPADARPGGYFGVVRFSPSSVADTSLQSGVASLIMLTVPGPMKTALQLDEFLLKSDTGNIKRWQIGDINLATSLKFNNTGDIHVAPVGEIYLKKGDEIIKTLPFNNATSKAYVLPDSRRQWSEVLGEQTAFGYYTVGITLSYGDENQSIERQQSFWLIPVWLLIAAVGLVGLLLIAVALVWRRHGRRRYVPLRRR